MNAGLLSGAVLLVVVGWLAACAEAGIARTSSFRAAEAVRAGRRGGAKLEQVAADPTRYLNVALLVRVACEMAAGVLVTYVCLQEFPETWQALTVAMAVMVFVSYVAIGVSPAPSAASTRSTRRPRPRTSCCRWPGSWAPSRNC